LDVIPSSTSHRFSNDNFIISRISSNALQDKVTISLRHKLEMTFACASVVNKRNFNKELKQGKIEL
ncbi:hypothetical protein AM593_09926, partial [Mytilus galloprovincialis]